MVLLFGKLTTFGQEVPDTISTTKRNLREIFNILIKMSMSRH